MTKATELNNIPTEEQNYLCTHWPETRRSLEILSRLMDSASEAAARILAQGDDALRKLQKGQPSRKRPLLSHGSHGRHR